MGRLPCVGRRRALGRCIASPTAQSLGGSQAIAGAGKPACRRRAGGARQFDRAVGRAVARHEEEAMGARARVLEAERALADLGDLDEARASVEDIRMMVEAARITMMSRRSNHDELRREGEARLKRAQEVTKELSGWRHRLETAEKRSAELVERKETSEAELKDASAAPLEIAAKRDELGREITRSEARHAEATDKLSTAEGVLRDTTLAEREAERNWR